MNVFIVEDSEASREYLQSILSDISGITVTGHAAAGEPDVIERIDTLLPDAMIFDNLRDIAAVGMLENIKKRYPTIKVMVLADCANESCFNRCKRVGVDYFFDRNSQLMRIRAVLWKWAYDYRLVSNLDALLHE